MFHGKYPAKAYRNGVHVGMGPWIDLVRESGIFGTPLDSSGPWWAGGESEEYGHARIIHHLDESVSVVALTEEASKALAAAELRIRARETGVHTLELMETRWLRVEITEEHLRNSLKSAGVDDQREGESLMDWYRRNAGERDLQALLTDDWGRPMSGVTVLPDTSTALVSLDGSE
jgi:hypothetical protein